MTPVSRLPDLEHVELATGEARDENFPNPARAQSAHRETPAVPAAEGTHYTHTFGVWRPYREAHTREARACQFVCPEKTPHGSMLTCGKGGQIKRIDRGAEAVWIDLFVDSALRVGPRNTVGCVQIIGRTASGEEVPVLDARRVEPAPQTHRPGSGQVDESEHPAVELMRTRAHCADHGGDRMRCA